jgi:uncharacterized integral membrane protein (TIGR00698 family)
MKKTIQLLPGLALSLIIAFVATMIEGVLPIHVIGASVIALFIGMAGNHIISKHDIYHRGIKFTSKKVLKFAIILLGTSLNITTILTVGKMSFMVMIFTLLTCFGGGYIVGKMLGLNWKVSNLISAGTGICGGSAIAAISPVIDAEDRDIALAMSATFLFDMAMIVLFPIAGKAMGLSDIAYGLWSGTAVNDTSSVVAAGYAFSEAAGEFATMVKLTRTLAIIPTVVIFSFVNMRLKKKEAMANGSVTNEKTKGSIIKAFPVFIVFFILMAILNSLGFIPTVASASMKNISKFLMVGALAAIGLNTNFKEMKQAGIKPMAHGFIISALVVIVALAAEYFMGIV